MKLTDGDVSSVLKSLKNLFPLLQRRSGLRVENRDESFEVKNNYRIFYPAPGYTNYAYPPAKSKVFTVRRRCKKKLRISLFADAKRKKSNRTPVRVCYFPISFVYKRTIEKMVINLASIERNAKCYETLKNSKRTIYIFTKKNKKGMIENKFYVFKKIAQLDGMLMRRIDVWNLNAHSKTEEIVFFL